MFQWLVPQVSHLGCNENNIRDTISFANEVKALKNNSYTNASFDVNYLFTNILIDETCSIVLDKFYPDKNVNYGSFNRPTFLRI